MMLAFPSLNCSCHYLVFLVFFVHKVSGSKNKFMLNLMFVLLLSNHDLQPFFENLDPPLQSFYNS